MSTSKLGRKSDNRNRTVRNLVTSLVLYEKIQTTEAKARTLIPVAERLITVARKNDLTARRYAKALLFDNNAVVKLFEDMAERWGARTSGFVRFTRIAPRHGDAAPMAEVELLLTPVEEAVAKESKTKIAAPMSKTTKSSSKTEAKTETPAV